MERAPPFVLVGITVNISSLHMRMKIFSPFLKAIVLGKHVDVSYMGGSRVSAQSILPPRPHRDVSLSLS